MSGNSEDSHGGPNPAETPVSARAETPVEIPLPKLEFRLKVLDYRLKVIGAVLTILGLFLNGFVYYKQKQKEIQSGFFKGQFDMYLKAASAAGKISAGIELKSRDRIAAGSAEFWEAYHGPMTLVEGRAADKQMVETGKLIRKLDEYLRDPNAAIDPLEPVFLRFQLRSDCLGTTLRNEIIESYDVSLPVDDAQLHACKALDEVTNSK